MDNIKDKFTDEVIQVKIEKTFPPKEDHYGNLKQSAIVIYKGNEYYATFGEKKFDICKEGIEVTGVRKVYKGNGYYEWHCGGDGMTPPPEPSPQNAQDPENKPDWDKIAEGKTRCAVVCAMIQAGELKERKDILGLSDNEKEHINSIVKFIFTGE